MATFLRPLSYRYEWLYNLISRVTASGVGGERRFRNLPLQGLTINADAEVLDLCCGSGQATRFLSQYSDTVTGLDASPSAIRRASSNVPQAKFVEGWAENMPFDDNSFDIVYSSAAMHEMQPGQRQDIFQEVLRVLKPGGTFTLVDFHKPHNPIVWPGLMLFLWLFETETSWQMLYVDLPDVLTQVGFSAPAARLEAGGSLQIVQATKPVSRPTP